MVMKRSAVRVCSPAPKCLTSLKTHKNRLKDRFQAVFCVELVSRIELPTSSLPMKCTTSVLHQRTHDTSTIIPKNSGFVKCFCDFMIFCCFLYRIFLCHQVCLSQQVHFQREIYCRLMLWRHAWSQERATRTHHYQMEMCFVYSG